MGVKQQEPALSTCAMDDAAPLTVRGGEEELDENAVLQFLLGKTDAIQKHDEDTSSIASTCSSQSRTVSSSELLLETNATDWPGAQRSDADPASDQYVGVDIQKMGHNCGDQQEKHAGDDGEGGDGGNATESQRTKQPQQPEDEDASIRLRVGDADSEPMESSDDGDELSIPTQSGKKKRKGKRKKATAHTPGSATRDLMYVTAVFLVLVAYCVGIVYRFVYPIHVPLPDASALYTPWDISNLSIEIAYPRDQSELSHGAMELHWHLRDFPAQAIREYGPEPFQYRVFLDDHQVISEVGVWGLAEEAILMATADSDDLIQKQFVHRLAAQELGAPRRVATAHELRIEVTFPIPGSDGELHVLHGHTSFVTRAWDPAHTELEILSPRHGMVVVRAATSIAIRYRAANVHRLRIALDHHYILNKEHAEDDILLLRGLAVGPHRLQLQAFDASGSLVATQLRRIFVGISDSEEVDGQE